MEESFRNTVCMRVVALSNALHNTTVPIPPPPQLVEKVVPRYTPIPTYVPSFELLAIGLIVGVCVAVFINALRA